MGLLLLFYYVECAVCVAQTVGLVHYPPTSAPFNGSVTVTVECSENAHIINSTSLNVTCTSNGSWSGETPQCQCHEGYYTVNVSGTQRCQGKQHKYEPQVSTQIHLVCIVLISHSGLNILTAHDSMDLSTQILIPVVSIMILTILIFILVICGKKLRKRTPADDNETGKIGGPHTKMGKKLDRNEDVPVVHNKAYTMHNVSRCIQVYTHPNEAYSVCGGTIINDEPVYEQVQ